MISTKARPARHVRPAGVVALVVLMVVVGAGWSTAAGAGTHGGTNAFDFSAPAVDGGTVRGADYRKTGVALWFWAPW